jgi:23S rRNA-/tRNA-specific pseudouridylate synthase
MQEALVGLFPHFLPSRKACRKALDRGDVMLNGCVTTTARRVCPGDEVSLRTSGHAATDPGPGAPQHLQTMRPLTGNYLFVWKPAGLATSGSGRLNLVNILRFQAQQGDDAMKRALTPDGGNAVSGPLPVHRLDRDTAGWVCVALSLRAAESLGRAFAERQVKKRYLALAAGTVERGSSDGPIDGKEAWTEWSPLTVGPLPVHGTATLLDVHIQTGRTHQIRRHLADSGHPVVGESRFAPPGVDIHSAPRYGGNGLFLCAIELSIPSGEHGPALTAIGKPPRKFNRIHWAAQALQHYDTDAS